MNKRKFGPWWLLLFFWAELCFMELVVHAATAPQFWQPELVLLMLYPLVPAVLLFALCRLFPPRANRVLGPVCSGLCYIFFASQLVYYSIFHCFYSAYSMGNGGQVMQFWKVTLHAIRKNWLPLSLMLLPPVGHAVLGKRFSAARLRLPYLPAFAALAAAVHFGLMALLPVFGTQPLSAYDLYHNTNDMKQTTAHLGLMPAFRLDVHRLLFGFEGGEIELATETKAPMEAPTEAPTEPALPDATEPTVLPEPVVDTSPNVLELDFDAVPTEGNDVLSELNAYFSSRTPTNKNEKTGMFEGCNLILITAESFSYLAIDPELTPTLYKLQTEGFNFTNFYTPYWDVSTSDGEYAAFGKVLEGAEVAIDISRVPRDMRTDQPKTPVVIESVQVDTQGVSYPAPQTH